MNLYEIDAEIAQAINSMFESINEETGEVAEGTLERLEALQLTKKEKLENCGAYLKNLESDAKAIKEEEANLKARRVVLENKADRLKSYILDSLRKEDTNKLETPRLVLSIRHSKKVEVVDENKIPAEYIKTKLEVSIDKIKAAHAFREGKEIEGLAFVESESLQVK